VLLLIWILTKATAISWRSYRAAEPGSPEARLWRIAAAIMPVLIPTTCLETPYPYSVAPFGWLLVGWIGTYGVAKVTETEQMKSGERELIVL
jgi:hypothetical protein